MEHLFVPYELAVKLKELGFDEECIAGFYSGKRLILANNLTNKLFEVEGYYLLQCKAPLWQQAFDWFREKYKFKVGIGINNKGLYYDYKIVLFNTTDTYYKDCYNTYKEAREACLFKLIELCQKSEKI